MQTQTRITTIMGSKDPPTKQLVIEDAARLSQIILNESDYDISCHNLIPAEISHHAGEDAALAAHLLDSDHASDLEGYEWNSEDLVREAGSSNAHDGDGITSDDKDQEHPRLACKDELESGIRREGTSTREYRESREERHCSYKDKRRSREEGLESFYMGERYGDEDGGAEVGVNWWSKSTAGGGEWSEGYEDAFKAGEELTEWKGEGERPRTRSETQKGRDMGVFDEGESAESDGMTGELYPWEQPPRRTTVSDKSAYIGSSSASIVRPYSKSNLISSPCSGTDIATLEETTALFPSSRVTKPTPTTNSKDSTPVTLESFDEDQTLLHFLDTCIAKTRSLLAEATETLHSTVDVDEITQLVKDEEESSSRALETGMRAQERLVQSRAEVVRVDRWWKFKGEQGGWREVTELYCAGEVGVAGACGAVLG